MSYFDIKADKEMLGEKVEQLQALANKPVEENRTFTNEEIMLYDNTEKEIDEIKLRIESGERVEKLQLQAKPQTHTRMPVVKTAKPTKRELNDAFRCWALYNSGNTNQITREMREAAQKCEFNLSTNSISIQLDALTDQITNPSYTVNGGIVQGISEALDEYDELRQACQVVTTSQGVPLPFLYVDETAVTGSVIEKSMGGYTSTGVTFGRVTLQDYLITTGAFPIPQVHFTDSAIDLIPFISRLLGKRLARKETSVFTNGAGSGGTPDEPTGLTTQITSSLYYPDPDSNAVAWYDVLAALQGAVAGPYAMRGGYMMSPTNWNNILRCVDSIGRPIFPEALGMNRNLLTKKVYLNPSLTDEIYFGDWSEVVIRQVGSLEVVVLRELYRADYNALGFLANIRSDIGVVDPSAIAGATVATSSHVATCGAYASDE